MENLVFFFAVLLGMIGVISFGLIAWKVWKTDREIKHGNRG